MSALMRWNAFGTLATLGFLFQLAFGALPAGAFRRQSKAIRQLVPGQHIFDRDVILELFHALHSFGDIAGIALLGPRGDEAT
jgi:hypothetical protein